MKIILKILVFVVLILILGGYIFKNTSTINGNMFIGIGVSLFAFILMPLFIYHRYNGRIGDFVDKRMEQPKSEKRS